MPKSKKKSRMSKRLRKSHRMLNKPVERVEPTPETLAKKQDDPLQKMVEDKLLDSAGERAAEEIKNVYLAVCREVINLSRPMGPHSPSRYEMSDDIAEAHATRYLPWSRSNRRQIVEATIDLVVERTEPRSGLLRQAVGRALTDYARRFDTTKTMAQKKIIDMVTGDELHHFSRRPRCA